jgi:glycosyltransferase involved in cell wall biosynthesis
MESSPKVSVVMCVFNGAPHLQRAIDSVLAQTFNNFELIVVDDGSRDQTPEILNSNGDERIKVVRNPTNLGIPVSSNLGIGLARANLIARLDSDDEMLPERLAAQVLAFEEHDIDLCFSRGWINRGISKKETLWTELSWPEICWRGLFEDRYGMHSTCMFNRQKILSIGGYDNHFLRALDYDLWDRCFEHNLKFWYLSLPLIRYYVHDQSITGKFFEEQEYFARQVIQRAMKRVLPGLILSEMRGLRWLFLYREKDANAEEILAGVQRAKELVLAFLALHPTLDQRLVWSNVAACLNNRRNMLSKPLQQIIWPLQIQAAIRARSFHTLLSTLKSLRVYTLG